MDSIMPRKIQHCTYIWSAQRERPFVACARATHARTSADEQDALGVPSLKRAGRGRATPQASRPRNERRTERAPACGTSDSRPGHELLAQSARPTHSR